MMRSCSILPITVLLAGILIAGAPGPVNAGYSVTFSSGATPAAVINDNNVPVGDYLDANLAVNEIGFFNANFAGYEIDFSGSTNTPAPGGQALQTQNTLTVRSVAGADPLVIDVFADGYDLGLPAGVYSIAVVNSISTSLLQGSTTGSAVTVLNGNPLFTTTAATVSGPTNDDSDVSPIAVFTGALPFSLNSVLTISGLSAGQSVNITWTSEATATAVPEPGALALAFTALPLLAGYGWLRRRKGR